MRQGGDPVLIAGFDSLLVMDQARVDANHFLDRGKALLLQILNAAYTMAPEIALAANSEAILWAALKVCKGIIGPCLKHIRSCSQASVRHAELVSVHWRRALVNQANSGATSQPKKD